MTHRNLAHGALAVVASLVAVSIGSAAFTRNIMLTGYWPPTNEAVRHFSANPDQNPDGWHGENWEGLGYNIYSYFPEFVDFPNDEQGMGDFEVDYQDTSEDWWRITSEINPVGIVTFSRGADDLSWELENRQFNRPAFAWQLDYEAPFRPTPAPPDSSVPANTIRYTSLPVQNIIGAVNDANLGLNPFFDEFGDGGRFLSEFIAYHGAWYHDIHQDPSDPFQNFGAGHIHVGGQVSVEQARMAAEVSLRELILQIDSLVPEPTAGTLVLLSAAGLLLRRRLTASAVHRPR